MSQLRTKILHLTIGPVQGFVAQARRTRDLWAGSFLLSYLSGIAMNEVLEAKGTIVMPSVVDKNGISDPLLRAINQGTKIGPYIGSLPNHFMAEVPNNFDVEGVCVAAINKRWNEIADSVKTKFGTIITKGSENIWNRQIDDFWDIAWVMNDKPPQLGDSDYKPHVIDDVNEWLDYRKNWRSYYPPQEGGDHCTIMGNWQELSGSVGTKIVGKKAQKAFWGSIRNKVSILDISEHERLCSISLVKRLYPTNKATENIIWPLNTKHWPSSSYMAAADWIAKVYLGTGSNKEQDDKNKQACNVYLNLIKEKKEKGFIKTGIFSEYNTNLKGLENAGDFAKLDGGYFFEASLENPKTVPFNRESTSNKEDESTQAARKEIIEGFKKLSSIAGKPSPYYAILAMDGDRLGALVKEFPESHTVISKSLAAFTKKVPEIVKNNMGATIYAGGDDVLAILPLSTAIKAAVALRREYEIAFALTCGNHKYSESIVKKATLSGGLVFANLRITMLGVLSEARRLLDAVAKEQNGRDSLAISVLTGSGRSLDWVSTWRKNDNDTQYSVAKNLDELASATSKNYSNSFFYEFRERFNALLSDDRQTIENIGFAKVLVAEYLKNREKSKFFDNRDDEIKDAEKKVSKLLDVCYQRTRAKGNIIVNTKKVLVDGALLVRFLIARGLEQ